MNTRLLKKYFSIPLTYPQIFLSIVGIVAIRVVLEWLLLDFPIQLNGFQDYARFFLENIYFFLIVMLVVCAFISVLCHLSLKKLMNFGVKMYPIMWLPPIFDVIFYSRQEGYYYSRAENFLSNILTFSFGSVDATHGLVFEFLLAIIFVMVFIYIQTRSIVKTVVAGVFIDVFVFFISTPDLVFGPEQASYVNDFFLPLYYFFPFVILLVAFLYFFDDRKLKALFSNLRLARAAAFVLAVVMGGIARYKATNEIYPFTIFLGSVAAFYFWEVCVIVNDIFDLEIDTVTNTDRPLVQNVFTLEEYWLLAGLLTLLSLSFAFVINYVVGLLVLFALGLGYAYSCPPFRLRKHFGGYIVIGLALSLCLYVGFFAVNPYTVVPLKFIYFTVFVFIFGSVLPLAKDIKDIEGDKSQHIVNVFTLFPRDKAKKIVMGILFCVLNLPAFFGYSFVIIPLSVLALWIFYKWESIRVIYVVGMLITCFLFVLLLPDYAPLLEINKDISDFNSKQQHPYNYVIVINRMNQVKGVVFERNGWLILQSLLSPYTRMNKYERIIWNPAGPKKTDGFLSWWPGVKQKLYFSNKDPLAVDYHVDVTMWMLKRGKNLLAEKRLKSFLGVAALDQPFQKACADVSCQSDFIVRASQPSASQRSMDILTMANVLSSLEPNTKYAHVVKEENQRLINHIIENLDYPSFMPYIEPVVVEEFLLLFYDQEFIPFLTEKARARLRQSFQKKYAGLGSSPAGLLMTAEGESIAHTQVVAVNHVLPVLMVEYAREHFKFLSVQDQ